MRDRSQLRIAWHWFSMGPYHFARMAAVARIPGVELTVIENTSCDDHGWHRTGTAEQFRVVSLGNEVLDSRVLKQSAQEYGAALERERPDVIVECGYSDRYSCRASLRHAHRHPEMLLLLWSESALNDRRRVWWREAPKRILLREFQGALCAGEPHSRYLERLGMPAERLCVSGASVDNDFFAREATRAMAQPDCRRALDLPERYFLYVGRFVPQKNLPRLLRAYKTYRGEASEPAALVLVGSGPQELELRAMVEREEIADVRFAGLKQLSELPAYYAFATCLVLPSTSEPWGLVVNEALATGLPAVISNRCGCAEELVVAPNSGFVFDPYSEADIARSMSRITANLELRAEMGRRGAAAVARFNTSAFAERSVRHIRELRHSVERRDTSRAGSRLLREFVL